MIRIIGTKWMSVLAVTAWLLLGSWLSPGCTAQDPYSGSANKPSFSQSIKDGFNKMGETFSPKSKTDPLPADDATSLSSKAKPSAELFVSIAKLQEEQEKPVEAERQYKKALQEDSSHLVAMLSYAHFLENQGRYDEAIKMYQRAIKTHPMDASAYNNLGLCHARMKKIKEATADLNKAVRLDPRNALYRNNISALLVEQNRMSEAFEQLRSVHGDAKAYYNLGYLLSKKGDEAAAEHHFRQALLIEPTLESAARWLNYLQHKSGPSSVDQNFKVARPSANVGNVPQPEQVATRILPPPSQQAGPSLGSPTAHPFAATSAPQANPFCLPQHQTGSEAIGNQDLPPYPDSPGPRRLPPVTVRQPMGSATPGTVVDPSDSAPAAPLPPEMTAP